MGTAVEFKVTADALAALGHAYTASLRAEAEQLLAILAVCAHHRVDEAMVVAGCERWISPGGDGTPQVGEFILGEISGRLHTSVHAVRGKVADALNLRFRHPLLFEAVVAGELPAWQAYRILRVPGLSELSQAAAGWVDAQVVLVAGRRPLGTVLGQVERWIVQADGQAAAERAERRARHREVQVSTIRDGHVDVWAQVDAADGLALDRALNHVADLLDTQPAHRNTASLDAAGRDPAGAGAGAAAEAAGPEARPAGGFSWEAHQARNVQRARALGVMARAVLGEPTLLDGVGSLDTIATTAGLGSSGAGRRKSPTRAGIRSASVIIRMDASDLAQFQPAALSPAQAGDTVPEHPVRAADDQPQGITLPAGCAEIDGWGVVTLQQLADLLTGSRVIARPVIDPRTVEAVDRHDPTPAMRTVLEVTDPIEAFPYGATRARWCQGDHTIPYADGGPPGQTAPDNLALLGGFAHRLKTHGGWTYVRDGAGRYTWRSRYGFRYQVDAHGTIQISRQTTQASLPPDDPGGPLTDADEQALHHAAAHDAHAGVPDNAYDTAPITSFADFLEALRELAVA